MKKRLWEFKTHMTYSRQKEQGSSNIINLSKCMADQGQQKVGDEEVKVT